MEAFNALLARDLKIAIRSGGMWTLGLVFFAAFLTLAAIALGGKFETLRPLAAPMIWLALVFAALLSFEQLFQTDADDGSLEHIKLAEIPLPLYVLAKAVMHWVLTILPLLLALPLAALLFDLGGAQTAGLFFAVLIASPAIICYGAFSGACLVGYKGGGMIIVLLTIPLLIPVLIFGVSGAIGYAETGLAAPAFQVLGGLSLIAAAIGIPAAGAALNSVME